MATTRSANGIGDSHATADARRILPTVDWIAGDVTKVQAATLLENRALAVTQFYGALDTLAQYLSGVLSNITTTLPTQFVGTLRQPDGSPAARIAVTAFLPRPDGGPPWPAPAAITGEDGSFTLKIPPGITIDASAKVTLEFRGADRAFDAPLDLAKLSPLGLVGIIIVSGAPLAPLGTSALDALKYLVPGAAAAIDTTPATTPLVPPQISLGDGDRLLRFEHDVPEERYPYSVLVRLVEPRASILTDTFVFGRGGGKFEIAARNAKWGTIIESAVHSYAERVPVDQPISVDGFRDRIVGAPPGGTVSDEETIPMAGTLGLGYVVTFAQKWTPTGLSLGDLVYSLPLAPGEQQKIAVYEQVETATTREFEFLSDEEQQRASQAADSSTLATFRSAFQESAEGGSSYATHADSSSFGVSASNGLLGGLLGGFGISGGGGQQNTSGNAYSFLDGAKSYASQAAESVHTASVRQSSARRTQQRTSMRLASATDTETATTKIITNNNRAHALTIQYWEVLRNLEISTAVQGCTLVAMIPLEIVRFLTPGEPLALDQNALWAVSDRAAVLRRYGPLLKHGDVLRKYVPWQYRRGLDVLEEFAADPRTIVQNPNDSVAEALSISVTGSFLPFERIWATVLTSRGTRIGPISLTPTATSGRTAEPIASGTYASEGDLLADLRARRAAGSVGSPRSATTLSAHFFLPQSLAPNEVIGFEIGRSFDRFSTKFKPPQNDPGIAFGEAIIAAGGGVLGGMLAETIGNAAKGAISGVEYSPGQLESLLGPPSAWGFNATNSTGETYAANYISEVAKVELPGSGFPVPAAQVAPILRFDKLLQIEQTLQHVVRNTITYAKAVWMSLTAEERAIMLEGYTIGVPAGGIADPATQTVPLLNCVANTVVGFYGNCMVMPFSIPKAVADKLKMTTGQVQDALTAFHRRDFSPPVSHVALPTRGVLGEAVLGHEPSAEKIDLTRFWNWQDSPIPQAPDIAAVSVGKGNTLGGAQAPNALGTIQPIITNVNTGGAAGGGSSTTGTGTDPLSALIAGQQMGEITNLSDAAQLAALQTATAGNAEKARSEAMSQANSLVTTAMKEMSSIIQTGINAVASIETGGAAGAKGGKDSGGNGKSGGKNAGNSDGGSSGGGNS